MEKMKERDEGGEQGEREGGRGRNRERMGERERERERENCVRAPMPKLLRDYYLEEEE